MSFYEQAMEASSAFVLKGMGGEDDSKGYALSTDPTLRGKQLATREYAVRHERLVRRVSSVQPFYLSYFSACGGHHRRGQARLVRVPVLE